MNEEARTKLDRIVTMEPEALTDGDRVFLLARRSELTEEQRIKFDVSSAPADADQTSDVSAAEKAQGCATRKAAVAREN